MYKLTSSDAMYIEEMIFYCNQVKEVMRQAEQKYSGSINDELVIGSLTMSISQIGEQLDSKKLSKELQEAYPNIKWSHIKRFRDLAYHHYGKINPKEVLDIYNYQIDPLIDDLTAILNESN